VVRAKRTFNSTLALAYLLGFAGCVSIFNTEAAPATPWLLAGALVAWVVSRFYAYS